VDKNNTSMTPMAERRALCVAIKKSQNNVSADSNPTIGIIIVNTVDADRSNALAGNERTYGGKNCIENNDSASGYWELFSIPR
jgi:hypothetical protein